MGIQKHQPAMSDLFATVFRMQSEQRRQRRKELKRLKREEKRRAQAEGMPIIERVELRRMLASERQAQMCARTGRDETAAADPQMCAEGEAQMCAPPGGEQTFREALQIARSLLGRRASITHRMRRANGADLPRFATGLTSSAEVRARTLLQYAVEIDVDALADEETVVIAGIQEHIEEAGIHSGDSSSVIPLTR